MKLLYIGDNSDSLNLGCRATSIAMRELASEHAELLGPVPTRMIQTRWPVSDTIGDAAYGQLAKLFNRNRFRALPVVGPLMGKVMDAIGTRDAITHDLEANADALARAQSYSADARALMQWIEEADGAVVNGEGDLIFGTPARQRLLFILTVCDMLLKRGKSLFYLNAMASPAPDQKLNRETLAVADQVLARASAFALRDPLSLEFAREHLPQAGAKAAMYPDAVFSWGKHAAQSEQGVVDRDALAKMAARYDHRIPGVLTKPYALIGGSSRSAVDPGRSAKAYSQLVEEAKSLDLGIAVLPCCTGDFFLKGVAREADVPCLPIEAPIELQTAILANAEVFISGRWHPSIMAALGGTPGVFMGSNSHKIIALQDMLGYPEPHEHSPWPDKAACASMIAEARRLIAQGKERRSAIAARAGALGQQARQVVAPIAQSATP